MTDETTSAIPVLPLRDVVVYPHMVIPLFVGREKSIVALDEAMSTDKQILLVAQKQADVDEPTLDDIYEQGTLATILQLLKLPDDTLVYPAHDYAGRRCSSIGTEKRQNPRLQVRTRDEYVEQMNALALDPPRLIDVAVPANRRCGLKMAA